MLTSLTIKNFQSHTDTHLELSPLTVIVGPSSAGKSAITRALKALASNPTGKDYITHGEATCQISATTDRGIITLTKGKPEDSYVILPHDDVKNPRRYTKLGGSVPPDVTEFLGIEPKDQINFAGQFDMPYLLRTSASEVARTLGELTNVSAIFEASREALRRKTAAATTLRTRTGDQAALRPKLEKFENLASRRTAADIAADSLREASRLQNRLQKLDDAIMTLQTATSRLRAVTERTDAPTPDYGPIDAARSRLDVLDAITRDLQNSAAAHRAAVDSLATSEEELSTLHEEYDQLLQEAGTCPTCGQNTEGVHHHG